MNRRQRRAGRARPTGSIDIAGVNVAYRALSGSEAARMSAFTTAEEDEAEVFLLVHGTGCTEDEARAFRDNNDTESVVRLLRAIASLSADFALSEAVGLTLGDAHRIREIVRAGVEGGVPFHAR